MFQIQKLVEGKWVDHDLVENEKRKEVMKELRERQDYVDGTFKVRKV